MDYVIGLLVVLLSFTIGTCVHLYLQWKDERRMKMYYKSKYELLAYFMTTEETEPCE